MGDRIMLGRRIRRRSKTERQDTYGSSTCNDVIDPIPETIEEVKTKLNGIFSE